MPCHGGWPTKHVHGILDPWKHGVVVYQAKVVFFLGVVPGFGMIWPINIDVSWGSYGFNLQSGGFDHREYEDFYGDVIKKIWGPRNIRNPPASPQGNKETSFGSGESSRNMIHALPLATLLFSLAGGLNILYIYKWYQIILYVPWSMWISGLT